MAFRLVHSRGGDISARPMVRRKAANPVPPHIQSLAQRLQRLDALEPSHVGAVSRYVDELIIVAMERNGEA